MKTIRFAAACAGLTFLAALATTPAAAEEDDTTCASIMTICMKRAGFGHAGICEDMYSQAKNTGTWPATAEPDGTKHDPVPCTR